jgi:hypothetical protein
MRKFHIPSSTPLRRLTATLERGGREYPFALCHRPINLGSAGKVDYYWIDSGHLRAMDSNEGLKNFANCVGHWWTTTIQMGLDSDPALQEHLFLALSYSLVSKQKSLQHVLRDAYLPPAFDCQQISLPDEDRERIGRVIQSHDRSELKREIDRALDLAVPVREDWRQLSFAFEGIMHLVTKAFQEDGVNGVTNCVGKLEVFFTTSRKRGGAPFRRLLIDQLAYECKASFYLTYWNLWLSLIPWLRHHKGLDPTSERFLRLWHRQNQHDELINQPALRCKNETAGPMLAEPGVHYLPDVFSGQILSLHPLSAIIMKDPALLEIVGRFVASPQYDCVARTGRADDCPLYWDFIGAILTAANLYRVATKAAQSKRGTIFYGGDATSQVAGNSSLPLIAPAFEEHAAAYDWRCLCGGRLKYVVHREAPDEPSSVLVNYRCALCRAVSERLIHRAEFAQILVEGTSTANES